MAGDGGAGFLSGFVNTAVVLEQIKQKKEQEDQRLAVQKEDLALRRDVLKGQIASRKLEDIVQTLKLEELAQNALKRLKSDQFQQNQVGGTPQPGTDTGTTLPLAGETPTPAAPPGFPPGSTMEQWLKDYGRGQQGPAPTPGAPLEVPASPAASASSPGQVPLVERTNNPLAIKVGAQTQYLIDQGLATPGPAATDGGRFLQFTDPQAGRQAAARLLIGPLYRDLTLTDALKKWSNNGYDGRILAGTDLDPQARVNSLSPPQITTLLDRMAQIERGGSGKARPAKPMTSPSASSGQEASASLPTPGVLGNDQGAPPAQPTQAGASSPTPASSATQPFSPQAQAFARASNPDRSELAQVTATLRQQEQLRTAAEQDAKRRGITSEKTVETILGRYDKQITELRQRQATLEGRLEPKTPEDNFFLSTYGMLPKEAQAIPGLYAQGLAAFEAQKTRTTKTAEDAFKRTLPLIEADPKHDYIVLATGQKLPDTTPYGDAQGLITQGKVKAFSPLNSDQARAYNFGSRALQAETVLSALEGQGEYGTAMAPYLAQQLDKVGGAVGTVVGTVGGILLGAPTGPGAVITAGGMGGLGGTAGYAAGTVLADPIANALRTPQEQQYFQAKMDFVSAVLRKESGAAISVGEFRAEDKRYFPQPGDSEAVIKQKTTARTQVLKTLEKEAGRPFEQPQPVDLAPKPTPGEPGTAPAPTTAPAPGQTPGPDELGAGRNPYAPGARSGATAGQSDDGTLVSLNPEQITKLPREEFERRFYGTARADLSPAQRAIAEARWRSRR